MILELVALVSETIGVLMIAFAAIMVHHRVLHEHKIDMEVEGIMKKEQVLAKFGVFFVLIGFVLNIYILMTV